MPLTTHEISTLPLFIGLNERALDDIATQSHFDQRHYKKGNTFIREYDSCNALVFVTQGRVETDTYANNRSYHLVERAESGLLIEPDKLFGLATSYRSSYTALTPCDTLMLRKDELMKILTEHVIARLNFLNIISRKAQHLGCLPWQNQSSDVKECIKSFIKQHSAFPTGRKTLYIKMQQLANELHFTRLEISIALNSLQEEEKIILKRVIIEIPELQLL